jgi:hypothetical protein
MGLQQDKELNELYYLKHRNDKPLNRHYPWEDALLKNTTSSYIWRNSTMNTYLTKIEKMLVLMVEKMNFARNFFNYTVDKYYNDHWG